MPIKKASIKDLRRSIKKAKKNRDNKENIAYIFKKFRQAVDKKDVNKANEWAQKAIKSLDKAAKSGLFKKNAVARKKSRLMKKFNSITK